MTDFVIINDVRQKLPGDLPGGPWIHHATVRRRFKEYIIFRNGLTGEIYLEQLIPDMVNVYLQKIEDINEWKDLYLFAKHAGLLDVISTETKYFGHEKNS